MIEYDLILWENYLQSKFGDKDKRPEKFVINLGDVDFLIPPLQGVDGVSFNAIKKHNSKKGVF
jgi:hypothetical protein